MTSSSTTTPSKNYKLSKSSAIASKKLLRETLRQVLQQKNYSKAIHLLNHLIVQEPQNSTYYSYRGLIYHHCEQWNCAIADYNLALHLNPNSDRIYTHRARCNAALKNRSEAIADYDHAIHINPHNMHARIEQGILFRTLEMYDEAIVCFGLALFLGKLSAHVYAERGRTYQLDGHWNCAISDYQHALSILAQTPRKNLEVQIRTWISELLD